MQRIRLLGCLLLLGIFSACEDSSSLTLVGSGKGGSMSRFAISDDHLYIVNPRKLIPYNIEDPWNPREKTDLTVGVDIETVFPYQHYLFIGSEIGMHIYDIANPGTPEHVSSYEHVRSCDPVVVQGDYAYVTLRTTTRCEGTLNVLEVVDISDITQPFLAKSFGMNSPHGLGIDGADLFVCDGDFGLVAFDATDPVNVSVKREITTHHAYDLILNNNLMIVTGEDGIYQYNYSSPDTLIYLSKINVLRDEL